MKIPSTKSRRIPFGKHRGYHIFNAAVFVLALLLLFAVKFEWFSVRCVYAEMGGCPGCGMTRAFKQLAAGSVTNIPTAFVVAFILTVGQLVLRLAVSIALALTGRTLPILRTDVAVAVLLLLAFVIALYK